MTNEILNNVFNWVTFILIFISCVWTVAILIKSSIIRKITRKKIKKRLNEINKTHDYKTIELVEPEIRYNEIDLIEIDDRIIAIKKDTKEKEKWVN